MGCPLYIAEIYYLRDGITQLLTFNLEHGNFRNLVIVIFIFVSEVLINVLIFFEVGQLSNSILLRLGDGDWISNWGETKNHKHFCSLPVKLQDFSAPFKAGLNFCVGLYIHTITKLFCTCNYRKVYCDLFCEFLHACMEYYTCHTVLGLMCCRIHLHWATVQPYLPPFFVSMYIGGN